MIHQSESPQVRELIVTNWWRKAEESLAAARSEFHAGRLSFAVNRLYFSLFCAVAAALARQGLSYRKHTAVRAAFHRDFVRTHRVPESDGRLYDDLFNQRQQGDYDQLRGLRRQRREPLQQAHCQLGLGAKLPAASCGDGGHRLLADVEHGPQRQGYRAPKWMPQSQPGRDPDM